MVKQIPSFEEQLVAGLRWRELYQFLRANAFEVSARFVGYLEPHVLAANVGEQWANGESVIICPRTGRYVELEGGA